MKSKKAAAETGFLANLRRNIGDLIAPADAQTPAETAPGDNGVAQAQIVNKVGKIRIEPQGSDVVAVRPALPASYFYPDAEEGARLHAELLRELPPGHPLAGVPLETFAASRGTDDTLFRFRGNPRRFVIVHLTNSGRTEIDEHHPSVEFDGTFEEFLERERELYGLEPPA